jgi:hypothetical protein
MPTAPWRETVGREECSALIRIYSDGPIRKSEPATRLHVEGHPGGESFPVPTEELRGGAGFVLGIEGRFTQRPRTGAPTWTLEGDGPDIILEIEKAVAFRLKAPMFALVSWEPGSETRHSIRVTSNQWTDADLKAAGKALRFLADNFPIGGPTAMSDEDAFAEAVRFGMEWLEDHPGKTVFDLKSHHLAARKCIEDKSYAKWMNEKRFGIKAVRAQIRELGGEK